MGKSSRRRAGRTILVASVLICAVTILTGFLSLREPNLDFIEQFHGRKIETPWDPQKAGRPIENMAFYEFEERHGPEIFKAMKREFEPHGWTLKGDIEVVSFHDSSGTQQVILFLAGSGLPNRDKAVVVVEMQPTWIERLWKVVRGWFGG